MLAEKQCLGAAGDGVEASCRSAASLASPAYARAVSRELVLCGEVAGQPGPGPTSAVDLLLGSVESIIWLACAILRLENLRLGRC
jgi:hypothetical protein